MLQEKCVRDITTTLQKTLARSYLQEFASRLDVDLNEGRGKKAAEPELRASPSKVVEGDEAPERELREARKGRATPG
jgi:hypothetical protein